MPDYRSKLQQLLRDLFEFDSADLDFGFYAVMNQKREQIAQFIEKDLLNAVNTGLQQIASQTTSEAQQAYKTARQALERQFPGLLQEDEVPLEELNKAYIANSPVIKNYQASKETLMAANIAEDLEAQIYNDLFTFFARYYQDGDFISQRRYGQSDKYSISYNGQEVYFHWANFDQYYVKTGLHFQNYSFTVPRGLKSGQEVNVYVRLSKVDIPRDNIKGEKRFFIFPTDQPVTWDDNKFILTIPIEYRPLTVEEGERVGSRNQQEKLLSEAYDSILKAVTDTSLRARLMESDPHKHTSKDRLSYHLSRYVAENTRDFFVHKDLKNFLLRELDYFLKAEVLRLEDINFDDLIHAQRAAARLKTIREIGIKIISFLDQLERFQRQLFLKRKFILQSDYCITLDKIPVDQRNEFYPEILSNEQQLAEWKDLLNVTITSDANLDNYPHLMLDTAFYTADFKHRLLACFDDLDAVIDGLIVHGENFQALSLLLPRYREEIKLIYIDPPYNTDKDDFVYKDNYQHSTWLSMMADRLRLAREQLSFDGSFFISIDDREQAQLKHLANSVFDEVNVDAVIVWQKKYSPQNDASSISPLHDYILVYAKDDKQWRPTLLPRTEEALSRYRNPDNDPRGPWKTGDLSSKTKAKGHSYKITSPKTGKEFYPPKGRQWAPAEKTYNKLLRDNRIWFGEDGNNVPAQKLFLSEVQEGAIPVTWWDRKSVGDNQEAVQELKALGVVDPSDLTPKPVRLITQVTQIATEKASERVVLDYFAGSGTTAHAVMNLNKVDGGKRKYILVEMGNHFSTVIKPRIQKVAYADEWKDGQPVLPENKQLHLIHQGHSQMFQYIRLESYDDTFHNIRFRDMPGPQLRLLAQLPDYILSYMLDHETANSMALLNIEQFKQPFDYKLLVTDANGVLNEQVVDLVETFNFLIGLSVKTLNHFRNQKAPYIRLTGLNPEGKQICVIWRNVPPVEKLDAEREWVLSNILNGLAYDKLYINGENTIPGAMLIEEEFKRRMFEGVY